MEKRRKSGTGNIGGAAQRTAAQKEKEVIKRAKGAAAGNLAGPGGRNLIDIEEGQQSQEDQQRKQQMLIQEEYDLEQLQERERSIRQLEVCQLFVLKRTFLSADCFSFSV